MIKILVLVFALSLTEILAVSEEMQELLDNLHNTCTAETGATDDMINNARKGDFSEDPKFKCYFKCIFDQMGCMTDDGKVDTEAVVALLPPDIQDSVGPIIKSCGEVGADPCDSAWLSNKCFQNKAPDQYFVP